MNPQENTAKQVTSQSVSAEVSATETENRTIPPASDCDLATVIDAWPRLPAAIQAGIVATVRAASG
jgi:hypothetical protein